MSSNSFKITLTYDQVLELVLQLPKRDRVRLSRELAKETVNKRLSGLLETFRTDEITEDEIKYEVENVRSEIYARKQEDQSGH